MNDKVRRIIRSFRSILGLFKSDILGIAAKEEKDNEEKRKEAEILAIAKAELEEKKNKEAKKIRNKKINEQKKLEELDDKQIRDKYGKMTPEERKAADEAEIIRRMGIM